MKKLLVFCLLMTSMVSMAKVSIFECSPHIGATNITEDYSYTIREKSLFGVVTKVELRNEHEDTWLACEKDHESGSAICDGWDYPYNNETVHFMNIEFNCEKSI